MQQEIPSHVGIILDGNRRWAKQNNKKTLDGHRRGAEVFKETSLHLFKRGVQYVTGYVFSTENWQRTTEEVDYLMRLIIKAVELHLDEYNKQGICIKILGSRDGLDKKVVQAVERTEQNTAQNTKGTLGICLNYGGKQEIVDAVQKIIVDVVEPDNITEEVITDHIYAPDIPDIDMLVRTSGEKRMSNFMMWRAQYAELFFVDTLWPDMTPAVFDTLLDEYNTRERRVGA